MSSGPQQTVAPLALQHLGASAKQHCGCPPRPLQQKPSSQQKRPGPQILVPEGHGGTTPKATPGMEANAPPTRAAPISLSALPRERVPLASPLARASKALSLGSSFIGSILSLMGETPQPHRVVQRHHCSKSRVLRTPELPEASRCRAVGPGKLEDRRCAHGNPGGDLALS